MLICTPINQHFFYIQKSISFGKIVLVEKPIVGSFAEIGKIEKMSKDKHKRLIIAENFRYLPSLIKLKGLIKEIKSEPIFVEIMNFQLWRKDNQYYNTSWRKNPKHNGGILLDGGIHLISVLNWYFKNSKLINKKIFSVNPLLKEKDTIFANFQTKLNTNINLNLSYGIMGNNPNIIKIHYVDTILCCEKYRLEVHQNGETAVEKFDELGDISNLYNQIFSYLKFGKDLDYDLKKAIYDTKFCLSLLEND